eukprot:scaffold2633_cov19-Tisochrysis_lutea.AAC.1
MGCWMHVGCSSYCTTRAQPVRTLQNTCTQVHEAGANAVSILASAACVAQPVRSCWKHAHSDQEHAKFREWQQSRPHRANWLRRLLIGTEALVMLIVLRRAGLLSCH